MLINTVANKGISNTGEMELMNNKLLIIILIFFVLVSCNKRKESGQYPLESFSKELLPESDTISFNSSTANYTTLELDIESNYFEHKVWDTDENGFGINYYYGDFEHLVKTYQSEDLKITYHLYVDQTNAGYWNFLITVIESGMSNEILKVEFTTEENYELWPGLEFQELIVLFDTTLYEVYKGEENGRDYYYQLGKGLVGFEYDGKLWSID